MTTPRDTHNSLQEEAALFITSVRISQKPVISEYHQGGESVEVVKRDSEMSEMLLAPRVLSQAREIRHVLGKSGCKLAGCEVDQGSMNLRSVFRFALT